MPRALTSLLIALLLLPVPAGAQETLPRGACGSRLRAEDIPKLESEEAKRVDLPARKAGTWYFVPLTLHIVRKTDGTQGLDPDDLVPIVEQLNQDFVPMQIKFYSAAPVNFIDDDDFYENINTDNEIDDLRRVDNVSQTVNVYFVKEFSDDGGSLCGVSSFSFLGSTQGIVMDNDCTVPQGNISTMTHEVGHYLDLFHTHEDASGLECVDGSNCSSAGDRVCDTPADPELGSHNVTNCAYVGADLDSCGGLPFTPPVDNFMSYAPSSCRVVFTAGQCTRAIGTLSGARSDHITAEWTNPSAIYVDARHSGVETGSMFAPYDTAFEGVLTAQGVGTELVIVTGGSYSETFAVIGLLGDVTLVATAGTTVTVGN